LPSKLKPISKLEEWAHEELRKNEDNIRNFSSSAIETLNEETLMSLKPSNK
jgi:hypothetical protein